MLKVGCICRTEQYERKVGEEYSPWLVLQINIIIDRYCVLDSFKQPQPVNIFAVKNCWSQAFQNAHTSLPTNLRGRDNGQSRNYTLT